jgi:hypothetical protein
MAASQPWTVCPEWLARDRTSGVPCSMRAFGVDSADLAVEFQAARRPELITELLEQCCRAHGEARVDRQFLLEMPVGLRIEAILSLAKLTDGTALSWQTRCAAEGCGQDIEFDLSLEQIAALAAEERARETCHVELDGRRLELRRPTGADQMRWAATPEKEQASAMLRSIIAEPSLDELLASGLTARAVEETVEAAMDAFDPLVGFHLNVACPECGKHAEVFPDLTGLALERLSHVQQGLISDVHLLASRYHWSEKEVLGLPRWRRQRYLELIEEEG